MRQAIAGVLVLTIGLASAAAEEPLPSAAERVQRSKDYFERGSANFNLGEYAAAIEAFEEGYRNKPLPLFLYNIAQCYRLLGDSTKALTFFRTYLREDPRSPHRREVLRQIGELEALPSAPAPEPAPAQPEASATPTVAAPAPPPAPVKAEAPPPARPRRAWRWAVLGVGLAVVVAAVVTTAVLLAPRPEPASDLGGFQVTWR